MNLNRELHEEFGYCWHEWEWSSENGQGAWKCRKCGKLSLERNDNPDYVADPRLVIREMMKREDWSAFCDQIGHSYATHETKAAAYDYIYLFYILDTTGKLAQLALDWLKEG